MDKSLSSSTRRSFASAMTRSLAAVWSSIMCLAKSWMSALEAILSARREYSTSAMPPWATVLRKALLSSWFPAKAAVEVKARPSSMDEKKDWIGDFENMGTSLVVVLNYQGAEIK